MASKSFSSQDAKQIIENNKNGYLILTDYFSLTDEASRFGVDVYGDHSSYQVYCNSDDEFKIDSFKINDSGKFGWTGTPLKINNEGDIHLGRYNTKIGFFNVEGIACQQAPKSASTHDESITLANNLRQILINYGLLK